MVARGRCRRGRRRRRPGRGLPARHAAGGPDLWWRLGFGLQHAHAARETAAYDVRPGIRPARAEDVPALAELDLLLPHHQALSPVFSAGPLPTPDEVLTDLAETLADERFTVLVAEDGGEVVGSAVACPVELSGAHSGLARLDGATFFAFSVYRETFWRVHRVVGF